MDQSEHWKSQEEKELKNSVSDFALKTYSFIMQKKYHNLLDLGCGRSLEPIFFADKGLIVKAIDISQNRLESLRKYIQVSNLKNIHVECNDIRNLPFDEIRYDVIYANLSLHYFDDKTTNEIFIKLYNILNSEGLLCIKTKSTKDHSYGNGELIEENMFDLNGHIRHYFDIHYMKKLLQSLHVISLEETFSINSNNKSAFIECIARK